jgi:hypothetical protein
LSVHLSNQGRLGLNNIYLPICLNGKKTPTMGNILVPTETQSVKKIGKAVGQM